MDENLLGYLLKSLDPAAHREVEAYLHANPEARRRVEALRQMLQPLAADRNNEAPPPGLRIRTLALIAQHQCRHLPYAPRPSSKQRVSSGRRGWRVPDLVVAAGILLCVALLVPPALNHVHHSARVTECAEN